MALWTNITSFFIEVWMKAPTSQTLSFRMFQEPIIVSDQLQDEDVWILVGPAAVQSDIFSLQAVDPQSARSGDAQTFGAGQITPILLPADLSFREMPNGTLDNDGGLGKKVGSSSDGKNWGVFLVWSGCRSVSGPWPEGNVFWSACALQRERWKKLKRFQASVRANYFSFLWGYERSRNSRIISAVQTLDFRAQWSQITQDKKTLESLGERAKTMRAQCECVLRLQTDLLWDRPSIPQDLIKIYKLITLIQLETLSRPISLHLSVKV